MRTRPALHLLTTLIALATGLALLGTALSVSPARLADPRSIGAESVVRAFYAALTEMIRTGDMAPLAAVVTDDFVAHGAVAAVAPDRAGLTRYLTALHRTAPDVEITVDQVATAGDRAFVYLRVQGGDEGSFLGLPLANSTPLWGTVDAVRVAGRRVVEHWSGASSLALREPLGQTVLDPPPTGVQTLILSRLTLPPGGTVTTKRAKRAHALQVESGAVTVAAGWLERTHADPPGLTQLTAGDLLAIPEERPTTLRNAGQTTASLLITTFLPVEDAYLPEVSLDPGEVHTWLIRTDWELTEGAQIRPLAGGLATRLLAGRPAVAVGRVTVPAGTSLPLAEASGPILLSVEQGRLRFLTGNEPAWVRRADGEWSGILPVGTLAHGDGAQFRAGTLIALDNPGTDPVVITIVAILPTDGSASAQRLGGPVARGASTRTSHTCRETRG